MVVRRVLATARGDRTRRTTDSSTHRPLTCDDTFTRWPLVTGSGPQRVSKKVSEDQFHGPTSAVT